MLRMLSLPVMRCCHRLGVANMHVKLGVNALKRSIVAQTWPNEYNMLDGKFELFKLEPTTPNILKHAAIGWAKTPSNILQHAALKCCDCMARA